METWLGKAKADTLAHMQVCAHKTGFGTATQSKHGLASEMHLLPSQGGGSELAAEFPRF